MAEKIGQGVELGLAEDRARYLVKKYGSNIDKLYELVKENSQAAQESGIPVDIYAQLLYSISDEFVRTPVDFFWRRYRRIAVRH